MGEGNMCGGGFYNQPPTYLKRVEKNIINIIC